MNKEFIPYEQALELKELGFDEPCLGRYWKSNFEMISMDNQIEYPTHACIAPTFSQVFRFFREKHNLHFYAHEYELIPAENSDEYPINVWLARIDKANYIQQFDTYEEAELACLNKLIELVKAQFDS